MRLSQVTGSIGDGSGQINDQLAALATGSIGAGSLDVVLSHLASSIKRIHGHAGSFSESAAGTFHQNLLPGTDDTYDLGSASAAWQDLHLEGDIKATDAMEIDTAAGALTIDGAAGVDLQEGGVSILNIADNRNVTVANAAAIDIDGSGAVSIDSSAGSMTVGAILADGQTLKLGKNGAVEMVFTPHGTPANEKVSLTNTAGTADDAISLVATAGGVTVQAGNDSLILDADGTDADALKVTSAGGMDVDVADEISLTTTSADGHISLVSAHTAGVALHIDADANAGSIVDVDAGILDIDVTGASTHNAGGAVELTGGAASKFVANAGNLVLSASAGKIELSGSSGADSVHVLSDMTIAGAFTIAGSLTVPGDLTVNGTTTTLDTANLLVQDPVIVMGVGAQALNSNSGILFTSGSATAARPDVALGRIDTNAFGIGSIANPNSGSITSVASMTSDISFRADSFQIAGATNQIDIDSSNVRIVAAADIVLDPAGNNVLPGGDSADDLGADGTAWRKLFVDDIDLNGQGRIDLDLDGDTSIRSPSDDVISFEAGGADVMSMNGSGLQMADDKSLVFGSNNDGTISYDEASADKVVVTGADWRFADNQVVWFGNDLNFGIEYDESDSDAALLSGSAHIRILGNNRELQFDGSNKGIASSGVNLAVKSNGAVTINATAGLIPLNDDGASLGSANNNWSDLFLADSAVLNFGDDQDVSLTHVPDNGLLLNGNKQLQFGDANTRIQQVADGILHFVADTQLLMDGGGGLNTHFSGTSRIGILDNSAQAFAIQEGANNYIAAITSNGSEKVLVSQLLDLDANLDMQGSRDIIVSDSDADALEIKNASDALLFTVNSANNFVGVPDNTLLGAGTGRDLKLSHNGSASSITNETGVLTIDSKGGNLLLTGSVANAEIQFGDAFSGAANITGGALSLAVSVGEYTDYISNFAANKSIVGALNDLAGGGTRGKFNVAITGSHTAGVPLTVNNSLDHDGGQNPSATDVYVNGQLMLSGTAATNGDYKLHGVGADRVAFFFALENEDQVIVIKA
tara:strand:- start:2752 stop:5874 length:3123 start_codon:yes stop_codon:yes gene_type:complete